MLRLARAASPRLLPPGRPAFTDSSAPGSTCFLSELLATAKGSTGVCSRCHLPTPGYDQLAERRFEFSPPVGGSRLPSVHHCIREISDASRERDFRWSAVSGLRLPRFAAAGARKPKGSKEIKTLYSLTLLVKDRGTSKP
jgi:hypothetical protein